MKARGVIFDLDGTLVDNMALHAEAFAIFVQRYGLPALTEKDRARLDGKRNRDIFPDIFGRPLDDASLKRYTQEKEGLYRELSKGKLAPVAGLAALLDALEERRIPVAIATSAPPENVVHSLAELGLDQRLTRIMRSDEVARGKPHPDVFLAAAGLIDVEPARCLAFEDAPAGILAARAAGMRCVAVTTGFGAEALASHGAPPDLAVSDYDAFLAVADDWLDAAPVFTRS